jgi:UDP-2-acetamido-3-amino-2,3-dideoxy-glucuronate N-acetyltransferase
MTSKPFIHETAVVEDGAKIGSFTSIWHFSHIERKALIGENCNLGQNTYVGNDALIGNGCRIGNSVSIFSHVELEDFVFCAPFMVFPHISYPRAAVNRRSVFETTLVQTGATLGANSTMIPGIVVGQGAFVAAGAVLTKSCKSWALMIGTPARHVGWVSALGDRIPLSIAGYGEWICPHTKDVYVLTGEILTRIPSKEDILEYTPGKKLERLIFRE